MSELSSGREPMTPRTDVLISEFVLGGSLAVGVSPRWIEHARSLEREVSVLRAALERTAYALELAFSKKPLRDMAETLAAAKNALNQTQGEG